MTTEEYIIYGRIIIWLKDKKVVLLSLGTEILGSDNIFWKIIFLFYKNNEKKKDMC